MNRKQETDWSSNMEEISSISLICCSMLFNVLNFCINYWVNNIVLKRVKFDFLTLFSWYFFAPLDYKSYLSLIKTSCLHYIFYAIIYCLQVLQMTQLMKISSSWKPVHWIEIINNKYFVFASATSC